MKKQILIASAIALFGITTANAQKGNGERFKHKLPEDRMQLVHAKFDSSYHFETSKQAQVDTIFLNYFKAQDKKMDEIRASGERPDRDVIMDFRKKLNDERDAKLKAVLTSAEMKRWKDEIEPSLRPPHKEGRPE